MNPHLAPSDRGAVDQRVERDLLGERHLPADSYTGIHTLRATENFPLTGTPVSAHPELVAGIAAVKQAAALAHHDLGVLDADLTGAVVAACQEIRDGHWHELFVVDVLQGGAGTSTNMNANEVIANRALELLGSKPGTYTLLSPNDHVNLGQSTNDAYPTAVRLALYESAHTLVPAIEELAAALGERGVAFDAVLKLGRTQLQDAVPMTLGQEFRAFELGVRDDIAALARAARALCEINMGGTAIGTGLNAHPGFGRACTDHLARITGVPVHLARDLVEATQSTAAFIELSSALRRFALRLIKLCNDLRLLASGPQAGLAEIKLPELQAGSSIMPGKVNPVVPEAVTQVCFDVIGADTAVAFAAQAGQLQLNAFEPLIAHSLLTAQRRLRAACTLLATACIGGITANAERTHHQASMSAALAAALNPAIGYQRSTQIARRAVSEQRSVRDVACEAEVLPPEVLDALLDPRRLVGD
ncbi:aspartate ammonia-lyase [Streptomyces sp. TLI_171]|uniref:aspartate ammonia-lyase n=1 Tax=Streptomyces sp. TLI_171 TaxID=1938859 RepID=UPI000C1A883C|nr:aspartate ammonia-lyase [Streptomyces sp. TLI_171]RKE23580.1 aspartate ammonia-lyase [Streptomyces sp. TLI_171]